MPLFDVERVDDIRSILDPLSKPLEFLRRDLPRWSLERIAIGNTDALLDLNRPDREAGAKAGPAGVAQRCDEASPRVAARHIEQRRKTGEIRPLRDAIERRDNVQGEHIEIAHGRDYDDVSPISGVLIGGGNHTVTVAVDVAESG